MKTIDDYCKTMDYRQGVAKEPWKNVVNFKIQEVRRGYSHEVSIGYGILLGPEGFILTSENVVSLVTPSSKDFRNVIVTNIEKREFALDNTFYRCGSGLAMLKTENPIEEAMRIGLDSSFHNHINEYLPIVPGDKELNDLFWFGYRSSGGEIVSSMRGVDTLFHAYTFDFSSIETIKRKIIFYGNIEESREYIHHQGRRLFPINSLGPLGEYERGGLIFKSPFFTGLLLNDQQIGSPVFVRDKFDYDVKSGTPENERQPKLYLVGIVDKGITLKEDINNGYLAPVCQVARAGSREIKKLLMGLF